MGQTHRTSWTSHPYPLKGFGEAVQAMTSCSLSDARLSTESSNRIDQFMSLHSYPRSGMMEPFPIRAATKKPRRMSGARVIHQAEPFQLS